jgi:hypothetical protein
MVNSPKGVGSLEEAMYLMLKGETSVLEINSREIAANKQTINGDLVNLARILTRLIAHA